MPPPPLDIRTRLSVGLGTHVGYSPGMSPRRVDREAWAKTIRDLVRGVSKGNKSAFARRVGLTTRTIDRWLAAEVDVSEGSVRQVAERLDISGIELLIAVGYYRPEELTLTAPTAPDVRQDPVIQAIVSSISGACGAMG